MVLPPLVPKMVCFPAPTLGSVCPFHIQITLQLSLKMTPKSISVHSSFLPALNPYFQKCPSRYLNKEMQTVSYVPKWWWPQGMTWSRFPHPPPGTACHSTKETQSHVFTANKVPPFSHIMTNKPHPYANSEDALMLSSFLLLTSDRYHLSDSNHLLLRNDFICCNVIMVGYLELSFFSFSF